MKKFYTLSISALLLLVLFTGCSKDILRSYEYRILGSWRITDIDKRGFGSSYNLPFTDGIFTFDEDGRFTWEFNGRIYRGSWDIRRERSGDSEIKTLHITAVDFNTQDIRTEYFNEIVFTNTNRMKAYIYDGSRTYVYRFLRL
jgi:hypothetical protein